MTLMTIPLSIGLIVFGYLARSNFSWLWLSSLMLFLQWFTDSFDGALGRFRDTGIPKWGFFMDHFLDFVFMSSIFIGYSFLVEGFSRQIVYLLIPAGFIEKILIYILVLSVVFLCVVVYRTQKYIWNIDMQNKRPSRK